MLKKEKKVNTSFALIAFQALQGTKISLKLFCKGICLLHYSSKQREHSLSMLNIRPTRHIIHHITCIIWASGKVVRALDC